jgi:hypothetical protein
VTVVRWLHVMSLVVAVGGNPIAAPEHAHGSDKDGSAHVLIHRHAHGHFSDHHHSSTEHRSVLDHDEGSVLSLQAPYGLPSAPVALAAPSLSATTVTLAQPSALHASHIAEYVARLTHGPPRGPTGLRAPPSSSRL